MSVPASATAPATAQIRLESSEKRSVEFAFNDTHFTVTNLTESTSAERLAFQSSHFVFVCSIGELKLDVPLSHVLWVGISGPVIDAYLLVKNRNAFKLRTVSASFQGDDPNVASNWVQGAMTAAYGGALRCDSTPLSFE
jgi:hypothetical protein